MKVVPTGWWNRLALRERRTVIAGAALLFVMLAVRPAVLATLATRADLAEEARQLASERRLLREHPARAVYEARLRRELEDLESGLFDQPDGVLLTSDARTYVEQIASVSAVSVQVLHASNRAESDPLLRPIAIELSGQGELEHALRFIHRLENGPRLMHVRALSLEAPAGDDGAISTGIAFNASLVLYGRSE